MVCPLRTQASSGAVPFRLLTARREITAAHVAAARRSRMTRVSNGTHSIAGLISGGRTWQTLQRDSARGLNPRSEVVHPLSL